MFLRVRLLQALQCSSLLLKFSNAKLLNVRTIQNYKKDPSIVRKLKPQDLGVMHNTIMSNVHERILNGDEWPNNDEEYSKIIYEELSTLCEPDDSECLDAMSDVTYESEYEVKDMLMSGSLRTFTVDSVVPEDVDFEKSIIQSLDKVFGSIGTLEKEGLQAFHEELDLISHEIQFEVQAREPHKQLVHGVISIAKGSGEFWTEIFRNQDYLPTEKTSDNGDLEMLGGRKLQTIIDAIASIFQTVACDVYGAIVESIWAAVLCPLCILNTLSLAWEVVTGLLRGAIGYSLWALGIKIALPHGWDFLACFVNLFMEDTPLDLSDIPLIGLIYSYWIYPCNSTSLFGPLGGPVAADAFPEVFEFLDNQTKTDANAFANSTVTNTTNITLSSNSTGVIQTNETLSQVNETNSTNLNETNSTNW